MENIDLPKVAEIYRTWRASHLQPEQKVDTVVEQEEKEEDAVEVPKLLDFPMEVLYEICEHLTFEELSVFCTLHGSLVAMCKTETWRQRMRRRFRFDEIESSVVTHNIQGMQHVLGNIRVCKIMNAAAPVKRNILDTNRQPIFSISISVEPKIARKYFVDLLFCQEGFDSLNDQVLHELIIAKIQRKTSAQRFFFFSFNVNGAKQKPILPPVRDVTGKRISVFQIRSPIGVTGEPGETGNKGSIGNVDYSDGSVAISTGGTISTFNVFWWHGYNVRNCSLSEYLVSHINHQAIQVYQTELAQYVNFLLSKTDEKK